jgi:hypothetical protein
VGIVIIVLGIIWAQVLMKHSNRPIFIYLLNAYGYFAPGIATMFLMGILWKRTTQAGALTAGLLTVPLSLLLESAFPKMPFLNRTGSGVLDLYGGLRHSEPVHKTQIGIRAERIDLEQREPLFATRTTGAHARAASPHHLVGARYGPGPLLFYQIPMTAEQPKLVTTSRKEVIPGLEETAPDLDLYKGYHPVSDR